MTPTSLPPSLPPSLQDLPPLESCDVPFPEGAQLLALGAVSHITEELVVIQSLKDTPPVDEGTVLWTQDKKSLSVVSTELLSQKN